MNLTHTAGTLDNIQFTVSIFDSGIINMKWNWDNLVTNKRVAFGVPTTLVDTTPRDLTNVLDTLDKFLVIKDQPFSIEFFVKLTA